MTGGLHSWAETTVYPKGEGGKDSPHDGDNCPACDGPLRAGEQVHRVTAAGFEGEWVHDEHVWRES
jgi:hypothetical protein